MANVRIFDVDGQTLLSAFPDQTTAAFIILRLNAIQHLGNVTGLREKNSDRIILSIPLAIGEYVVELSPSKNRPLGEHIHFSILLFVIYKYIFNRNKLTCQEITSGGD